MSATRMMFAALALVSLAACHRNSNTMPSADGQPGPAIDYNP